MRTAAAILLCAVCAGCLSQSYLDAMSARHRAEINQSTPATSTGESLP